MAVVLTSLVVASFVLIRMAPGDPVKIIAGLRAGAASQDQIRKDFNLDQGYLGQFWDYVVGILHGDLGTSFRTGEPVTQVIADNVGPTFALAFASMVIVVVLGGLLGFGSALMARRGGRMFEVTFSAATGILTAIPNYLLATFLVFAFALTWPIFPVGGEGSVQALVLPSMAIALGPAALVGRMLRIRTLEVLEEPYVRTARSKRLSSWQLFTRHILTNSLTTVVPLAGVLVASLVGGAVVAEQVFARRGLGTTLVDAVLSRDYPVVQGVTLFVGVTVVIVNVVFDLLAAWIDPKVKDQM